eukprot:1156600-Pelagomonas_calceolata.AAC.6
MCYQAQEGLSLIACNNREERPVTIMSLKLWRSDGGNMATGSSISAQTLPPAMPHKDSLACGTRTAPMGAPSTSDARQGQDSSSGAQGSIEGQPASSLHSSGRSADRTISSSSSSSSSSTGAVSPGTTEGRGLAAADDMGGRAIFQQRGAQMGPHRPRQDVFFSVSSQARRPCFYGFGDIAARHDYHAFMDLGSNELPWAGLRCSYTSLHFACALKGNMGGAGLLCILS